MTTVKLNPNVLYQTVYGGAPDPDAIPGQTQVTAIATILDAVSAAALQVGSYAGTVTVSGPFSGKPIIQKTTRQGGAFGLGAGPVPVQITLSAAVAYLEYQVVDATTGAVIEAWQPYAGSVRPGTQTINPIVSCRLGWNFLQFRANGYAQSVVTSTVPFGVGDNVLSWGQSLAVTKVNNNFITSDTTTMAALGITPSPYGSVFCAYAQDGATDVNNPPTWAPPADGSVYSSAFLGEFLNLMIAAAGYNIGFVGYSVGSSSVLEWLPNSTVQANERHLAVLLNIIKLGITGWAIEMREQGHADAKTLMPSVLYRNNDSVVRNAIELYNSVTARTVLQTIPALGVYAPATPASVMAIRAALKQVADQNASMEYVDDLNATQSGDFVHPSQAGEVISAQNCYRACAKLLGLLPVGSYGPYISGTLTRPSTAPTTIVIPVQQRQGTAIVLVGTPTDQFKVFLATDTAFARPLTVSAISATETEITLTLANDPGVGVALNVIYRPGTYDTAHTITSDGIYDNYVNADGITTGRQLVDPAAVMPVAGTVPAMTVATPAATTAGTAITITGSYFGGQPPTPTITVNAISATTSGTAINVSGSYVGELNS